MERAWQTRGVIDGAVCIARTVEARVFSSCGYGRCWSILSASALCAGCGSICGLEGAYNEIIKGASGQEVEDAHKKRHGIVQDKEALQMRATNPNHI